MREILFRGKRIDNGEWVCGYYVYDDSGQLTEKPRADIIRLHEHPCGFSMIPFEVMPESVSEFTGLTDKNGKKIFEGDIIRFADIYEYEMYLESLEQPEDYEKNAFDNMWTINKVVYGLEYSYPAFDLSEQYFDVNGLSELSESFQYHYEVIGNIHDNPELMEEGAK